MTEMISMVKTNFTDSLLAFLPFDLNKTRQQGILDPILIHCEFLIKVSIVIGLAQTIAIKEIWVFNSLSTMSHSVQGLVRQYVSLCAFSPLDDLTKMLGTEWTRTSQSNEAKISEFSALVALYQDADDVVLKILSAERHFGQAHDNIKCVSRPQTFHYCLVNSHSFWRMCTVWSVIDFWKL